MNTNIGDIIREDYVLALIEEIQKLQEHIEDLEKVIKEYEKDIM